MNTHRIIAAAVGLGALGGTLALNPSAFAQSPSGGTVSVYVLPAVNGPRGTIVLTGAIGDYGTTLNINAAGKVDDNGNYAKLTLKHGTIIVNLTQENAANNNLSPTVNSSNCSLSATAHAPVEFVRGTGAYVGISGTLNLTTQFGAIGPKGKNGACNENGNPKAQIVMVTGSGTVSF